MKTKSVLLVSAMLLFTTFIVTAQESGHIRPAPEEIIHFGQKLPPPNLKKPQDRMPGNRRNSINRSYMPDLQAFNAQDIKKDPGRLKQLLAEERNNRMQRNRMNAAPVINRATAGNADVENGNNQKADFGIAKDINALAESFPRNDNDFDPTPSYAVLDGVIYFAADDGIHGNELWRSDGTAAGTYMVKDISPGSESTVYILNITAANGKLFFSAYTTAYGYEPWVSDGTGSGTHLLLDIAPGADWSFPTNFISLGNSVYFVSDMDGFIWSAIWKTDGTAKGTTILKNLAAEGNGGEFISQLTTVNDHFFFTYYSFNSFAYELWKCNGTKEGTQQLATNTPFVYGVPAQLTSYNNQLFFSAEDSTGRKLWVSDGTDKGTKPAPKNGDVLIYAEQTGVPFPIVDSILYIPAISEVGYIGALYKYNASDKQGMVKVKQFEGTAPNFIVPFEMTAVADMLYFRVLNLNGELHDELWSTKSNSNTAQLVQKFEPGEAIYNLYNGDGVLYFGRVNKGVGTELWGGIATANGTLLHLVSDVFKGVASSNPFFLTAFKGKLFFSATDDKKGTELFASSVAPFATSLVKDINVTSTSGSSAAYFGNWITQFNDGVLFTAYENAHGFELYRSNGSAEGTRFLNDIFPGEAGSYPDQFLSKNGKGYFIAQSNDTMLSIYRTNGTASGLQKITPHYDYRRKEIVNFDVADNGLLFYVLFNYYTFGYELWRSDGTAKGTFLLTKALYVYNALHIINNTALFVAGDKAHGYELWRSDGSIQGTRLVRDINAGTGDAAPGGLFVYNNEVYFGAYDGTNRSLWKSDGSSVGTVKLKNIYPLYGNTPAETARFFGISNSRLFFGAISAGKGIELWKTDGTAAGTQVVMDINPDGKGTSGMPFYLTDVQGTLFFIAEDGVHGQELWKTKGTAASTRMVKDITPGADSSYIDDLVSYAGKLYFTNSYAVWSSDGTTAGTVPVNDGVISEAVVNNMLSTGNQLFLSGYTYKTGWELYTGMINTGGVIAMSKAIAQEPAKTTSFNVTLYPNPVSSNAKLQITGNINGVAVSVTDMNGRQLWQSSNITAAIINLPVERLAKGAYVVTVTNGKESKTVKLLKQ